MECVDCHEDIEEREACLYCEACNAVFHVECEEDHAEECNGSLYYYEGEIKNGKFEFD